MTHMSTKILKATTVLLATLATLFGLANSGTIATAEVLGETGKIYYLGDSSKQELFRTRPAPGAILPGEKNYDQCSEEVVAVWEDGTQVLKNSIVINPDGSITLPEGYYWEAKKDDGWWISWYAGTPSSRWDEESQQWTIVYDGPIAMEKKHPDYYSQPYVDDEGIVHTPGSEDYHPELCGMWGFVPPVLRPEGYVPGEPWPTELDWDKLPELTARAEGTNWDSTTVFDRWIDGTRVFGNGIIVHPNGVFHLPNDWQSEVDGVTRHVSVIFDETSGEWWPVYDQSAGPIEEKPDWEPVAIGKKTAENDETDSDEVDQIDSVVDTSETEANCLDDIDQIEPSETESVSLNEVASTATEETPEDSLTSEPLSGEGQMVTIDELSTSI